MLEEISYTKHKKDKHQIVQYVFSAMISLKKIDTESFSGVQRFVFYKNDTKSSRQNCGKKSHFIPDNSMENTGQFSALAELSLIFLREVNLISS